MRLPWIILLLLVFPFPIIAKDIPLPEELEARAFVIYTERYDLWEKSLVVQFSEKRRVLSTMEGFLEVKAVVNHSAHSELWKRVCEEMKTKHEVGGKIYLKKRKEEIAGWLGLEAKELTILGTAADMDNLAVVTKVFKPYTVTALVTAGARTNALRTGLDEGSYLEGERYDGTVNIILLTNARFTDGAIARAIITATEAKTAAFEDLKVPSSYTEGAQATGTGTDNIIIVSGVRGPTVTYSGGHSKIGELIGKAVYEAVMEALYKQNGFKRE